MCVWTRSPIEDRDTMRELLDRDMEHWTIAGACGAGEGFDAWWTGALDGAAERGWVTYLIRDNVDQRAVGTSSYLNPRAHDRVVEIGSTFLHPDARGAAVNPESKRLMLAHAFDAGAMRVEFMVDARNHRSQGAVEKLGAFREGVLRRNRLTWTGHQRDTVVFSIVAEDWPAVRERLDFRLQEAFV
jgi:RimJ/RimL family protein N-acetyltransferase